jgi:hypothetical protein
MTTLPVERAHALPSMPLEQRWLIDSIWCADAVGIVGGEPKCCKSFLALDMAISVASGQPFLGRFPVSKSGPVLLFAAEDALHIVRSRLEGIAARAGAALEHLDIQVITAPSLRIDQPNERDRLERTVAALRPRLLILDPFVRLHRIDENVSSEVAPLLGHLRELQRAHGVAVVLVHHAKKGAARIRAGQALRGSSEFHAWGDSNLYLRRVGEELLLSVEHRAARSITAVRLALRESESSAALVVLEDARTVSVAPATQGPIDRVEAALAKAERPLTLNDLRAVCRIRKQDLLAAVRSLCELGRVQKTQDGFVLHASGE